jgi:hypothetical protein
MGGTFRRFPSVRWLRLHLTHGVGEHPEGAVQLHVLIDAGHRAGGNRAPARREPAQAALREVFLHLCDDAAYVEQLNRPRISLVFLAQHLHITFRFALALRSLIYFER